MSTIKIKPAHLDTMIAIWRKVGREKFVAYYILPELGELKIQTLSARRNLVKAGKVPLVEVNYWQIPNSLYDQLSQYGEPIPATLQQCRDVTQAQTEYYRSRRHDYDQRDRVSGLFAIRRSRYREARRDENWPVWEYVARQIYQTFGHDEFSHYMVQQIIDLPFRGLMKMHTQKYLVRSNPGSKPARYVISEYALARLQTSIISPEGVTA